MAASATPRNITSSVYSAKYRSRGLRRSPNSSSCASSPRRCSTCRRATDRKHLLPQGRSEAARDQYAHDLRRATLDAEHAGVRKQSANLVFAHETVTTEELQALIDQPSVHLRGPQFGGRCRIGRELAAN